MGKTTYSGPIAAGTVKEGSAANVGHAVMSQSNTVDRTDTSAKDLFIIPAGSEIVDVIVAVPTASNAGTTADVTVAIKGGNDLAVDNVLQTGVKHSPGAINVADWMNVGTSDVTITGVYAESGANSTTGGPFTVIVNYVQK